MEEAADSLVAALPSDFQADFKVFDAGFYLLNEKMQGGYPAVFEKFVTQAAAQSKYYLLVGRGVDVDGQWRYWVDLALPKNNIFTCLDLISPYLRGNLCKKYSAVANDFQITSGQIGNNYFLAEMEVITKLKFYIEELKECCDFVNRNRSQCNSCVMSNSQFESSIAQIGLIGASIDKVIDNTKVGMGEEEIGYKFKSGNIEIDLDMAILDFKTQIHTKFPAATIKVFPFNYQNGCSNFDLTYSNFKSTNAEIGLIIGVTGDDGKPGNLWWQMISKDDEPVSPITFDSDTCYYFDSNKKFKNKSKCTSGIRPRGILEKLDGLVLIIVLGLRILN